MSRPETITLWRGGKLQTFPITEGLDRLAAGWKLPGTMLHKLDIRIKGK